MLGIRYGHWSDNVASQATVTATPADPAYPAAWATDLDPARPAKLSAGTGAFVFTFPTPQRVDAVAIIHHNLSPGLDVEVQGGAPDFASPAFNHPITIPPYRPDGFCVSPWLDLTTLPGYTPAGQLAWRVAINNNPVPAAIGEIVLLSTLRSLDRNPQWGFVDTENHPLIEHATDFGVVTIYEFGTLTRTYSGQIIASDPGAAELRTLARDARFRARPWLFVPDAAVNEAWLVRFTQMPQARTHQVTNANPMLWTVEELSRGLPL
jgi:hypothetical protein